VSARFGQNLRALRDRADLTQRGLAKRLGFKGPSTVSHWESGTCCRAIDARYRLPLAGAPECVRIRRWRSIVRRSPS